MFRWVILCNFYYALTFESAIEGWQGMGRKIERVIATPPRRLWDSCSLPWCICNRRTVPFPYIESFELLTKTSESALGKKLSLSSAPHAEAKEKWTHLCINLSWLVRLLRLLHVMTSWRWGNWNKVTAAPAHFNSPGFLHLKTLWKSIHTFLQQIR